MSNNMSVFQSAGLPAVSSLTSSLRSLQGLGGGGGSEVFLRFDKTGHWVFGSEQTEVEKDSQWAVNPYSFLHGWIAWGAAEVLGEVMAPVTDPLPAKGPTPDGSERGWQAQISVMLKCLTGEDEDIEARFGTTSLGGKKALQSLALAIAEQCEKDPANPVPVVVLGKDSYVHKKYGKIPVPTLTVVKWLSLTGEPEVVEPEPEPEAPARRQRVAR